MDLSNKLHLFVLALTYGLAGMVAYPIILWGKKLTDVTPVDYLFRVEVRRTVLSFMTLLGAAFGAIAANAFENMNVWQIGLVAFPWGMANDAVANSASKVTPPESPA